MPKKTRVLLVDDDDTFRQVMASELSRRGYSVDSAATGRSGLDRATRGAAEVILLDMRLPDIDGIEVLQALREKEVSAGVVVLTGHGTIDTAIQAIRLGAYDYLEKPCPLEEVELAIEKTLEHLRVVARKEVLEDGYAAPDVRQELVGESPAFKKLLKTVDRIAQTNSTTLILGETGVGKEMVAMLLHAQSQRKEAPFVVVDCAALHEELLENELFGHEKGAFTGATRRKHGLFEVANGGTIFLDEVGDTNLEIQARLLRVLETGRFRRLGGTEEITVDVRVLSATNRNLREAVTRGHFREDLFFRLATLTVEIPPLREREEDIRTLIDHFTGRFNLRFSAAKHLSPVALKTLIRYPWPGNVRELAHVLEQVMVLADREVVEEDDLPSHVRAAPTAPATTPPPGETPSLREVQRRYVLQVIQQMGGNRAKTARALQISERHLYRLLKKYGWSPSADPDIPSAP